MVKAGVRPNEHIASTVINALAKSGDPEKALAFLSRMESEGVPVDVVAYSTVIDSFAKEANSIKARDVFNQMQAKRITPNVVCYSALAMAYANRGHFHEVESLSKEMASAGVKSNHYFLSFHLRAYGPSQADRAEAAFIAGVKAGVSPNKFVVGALRRAVGRDRAQELKRFVAGTSNACA